MNSAPGSSTPTLTRNPRIQIPSSLPSLLQTELLFLDRLLRKNKPQHRSSIFFQKVTHVLRLGKRIAAVVDEVGKGDEGVPSAVSGTLRRTVLSEGDGGRGSVGETTNQRCYKTLCELVDKTLPAITKASEVLEKMINHLHFLPLITTLLAITSRMFVITIDIAAYLLQYRETTRNPMTSGSSTPVLGNTKEKDKDKVSFSFEEVVEMVVSGKVINNRIKTAQEQLRTRLETIAQQATAAKGKEKTSLNTTEGAGPEMVEMEGEDFGEAVGEPVARVLSPMKERKTMTQATPIVLDPPSSPDEPLLRPSGIAARPVVPGFLDTDVEPVAGNRIEDIEAAHYPLAMPLESAPTVVRQDRMKRPVDDGNTGDRPASKKKASVERKASRSTAGVDKVKAKKKKGKDAMDDIFG